MNSAKITTKWISKNTVFKQVSQLQYHHKHNVGLLKQTTVNILL